MWKVLCGSILAHLILFNVKLGKRGEVGPDGKEIIVPAAGDDKKFSQTDVDGIVQERIARERKKYGDYDELRNFKTEHQKSIEDQQNKTLEEQKKYEELKKGWGEKEKNYAQGLLEKDTQINSLKISHALATEVSKLNAHPEATQILQSLVTISDDGTPQMSGKDTVGNDVKITLAEGVKQFLDERPHLVRANGAGGGGGTPPAGGSGGRGADEVTLNDLNKTLLDAKGTNNHKVVEETKAKIRAKMSSLGINRNI